MFHQLSESPASLLPCPPAETAEINQYDLADALIDTEKSNKEEALDPGIVETIVFKTTEDVVKWNIAVTYIYFFFIWTTL